MNILVDSSVWIDYFRGGSQSDTLDTLIKDNLVCTNYLILAELLPGLKHNGHTSLVDLLLAIKQLPLSIDWKKIIDYQSICISKGINKVGIPDLIILDNVIQNQLSLFSLDKHFKLMRRHLEFRLFV